MRLLRGNGSDQASPGPTTPAPCVTTTVVPGVALPRRRAWRGRLGGAGAGGAGREGALIVAQVKSGEGAHGYNVATDKYEDLVAAGVVDPTKVTRSALQNAASIAGLMLTTECLISDIQEEKKEEAPHSHDM